MTATKPTQHNFITICTKHDNAYKSLKTELEQIRSWAVELQAACEALESAFENLETLGKQNLKEAELA